MAGFNGVHKCLDLVCVLYEENGCFWVNDLFFSIGDVEQPWCVNRVGLVG